MDPLALIGAYGDSDSSDESEDAPPSKSPPCRPARAESSSPVALPDADSLLDGLPDWNAQPEAPAPRDRDAKGTLYNSVPMGQSLIRETEQGQAKDARRGQKTAPPQVKHFFGGAAKPAAPAKPPRAPSGPLLPPQLRRPNVSTEDKAGMGCAQARSEASAATSKRQKAE